MNSFKRPSINWMAEGKALRDQVLMELVKLIRTEQPQEAKYQLNEGKALIDQVLIEWRKANRSEQPQEAKYQLNDWRESLKRPIINWMKEGKSKLTASKGQVSTEWL